MLLGPKVPLEIRDDRLAIVTEQSVLVFVLVGRTVVNGHSQIEGGLIYFQMRSFETPIDQFFEPFYFVRKFLLKPRLSQVVLGLVLEGDALFFSSFVAGVVLGLANLHHGGLCRVGVSCGVL